MDFFSGNLAQRFVFSAVIKMVILYYILKMFFKVFVILADDHNKNANIIP